MKRFFMVNFIALYLAGCASPTPIQTVIPSPSPLPTFTLTPIPTETPQPTQTPVVEKDTTPIYTENIVQEFMGVEIATNLMTDESLSISNPSITKISINPSFNNYLGEKSEVALTHFIAKSIFVVWWKKGEVEHKGVPTEDDFKTFMETWSEAQKENNPASWNKVQFSIFANDLTTEGYTQEKVTLWPMYSGSNAPDEIKAIKEINIVFVRGPRVKNITIFSDTGPYYGDGFGANIEENNLFMYVGIGYGYTNPANNPRTVAGDMSAFSNFLLKNTGTLLGREYTGFNELFDLLGITNHSNRTVIVVYPSQR